MFFLPKISNKRTFHLAISKHVYAYNKLIKILQRLIKVISLNLFAINYFILLENRIYIFFSYTK